MDGQGWLVGRLVGWSLTSLVSTDTTMSEMRMAKVLNGVKHCRKFQPAEYGTPTLRDDKRMGDSI